MSIINHQSNPKHVSILACGWLGLPFAQHLVQQGINVSGSTTTPEKMFTLKQSQIEPHLCTVSDSALECDTSKDFFNRSHIAIILPFKRSFKDPKYYLNQIKMILPYLEKSPVKRVLFTSSTSIYPCTNDVVTEETPYDKHSYRAEILHETEQLLLNQSHFETTVIRFSGLYGGSRQAGQFLRYQSIVANPDHPVNLIHLDDCIEILYRLLIHPSSNLIVNACADEHPKKREFYTWAARELGVNEPTFQPPSPGSTFKIVSNKRLHDLIHYTLKTKNPLNIASST